MDDERPSLPRRMEMEIVLASLGLVGAYAQSCDPFPGTILSLALLRELGVCARVRIAN
jgi:hypothetical protein